MAEWLRRLHASRIISVSTPAHWESIYGMKAPDAVSWYRPHLDMSLDLIERAVPGRAASILDVGGGESTLGADLTGRGYRKLIVMDLSWTALGVARQGSGLKATETGWVCGDVRRLPFARASFDVWHDRAVFHFLTTPEDRTAYVQEVLRTVRPGGHLIVSTFGPEGPERCSGLPVVRYDEATLHAEFGGRFQLVASTRELHHTPWGAPQQFVYCYCRVS